MSALARRDDVAPIRIPDERVIAMIAGCSRQIAEVSSIEDAVTVTDAAAAIAAIAKKVKAAKEVKKAAVRLLVDAEAKLGEVLQAIPKAQRHSDMPKKRDVLKRHGIGQLRASVAQRLAKTPEAQIEKVIDSGAASIHAIGHKLGFHADNYERRMKRAGAMADIADEAVSLLVRCVRRNQVPHAGTVANLERWLTNVKAHGNKRGLE